MILERLFEGGILINKEDVVAALVAVALVARAGPLLPEDRHRPRAARGGRRPPGGAVDRHPAQPHLGHRLVGRRHRGAGRRRDLGFQARRAVLRFAGRAQGAAGGDPRRPDLGHRRDHRRADHRRRREDGRGVPRPGVGQGLRPCRRRHRELVRLRARTAVPAGAGRKACSARSTSTGSRPGNMFYRENGQFKSTLRRRPADAADPAGPRLHGRAGGVRLRAWCRWWRATTCSCRC